MGGGRMAADAAPARNLRWADEFGVPHPLRDPQELGRRLSCGLLAARRTAPLPLEGKWAGEFAALIARATEVPADPAAGRVGTVGSFAAQLLEAAPQPELPFPVCAPCGVSQRHHRARFCHSCGSKITTFGADALGAGPGAVLKGGALREEHLLALHLRYCAAHYLSPELSGPVKQRLLLDLRAQALSQLILARLRLRGVLQRKARELFWRLVAGGLRDGEEIFLPLSWALPAYASRAALSSSKAQRHSGLSSPCSQRGASPTQGARQQQLAGEGALLPPGATAAEHPATPGGGLPDSPSRSSAGRLPESDDDSVAGTVCVCFRRCGEFMLVRVDCVDAIICHDRHSHWVQEGTDAQDPCVTAYVVACVEVSALAQCKQAPAVVLGEEELAASMPQQSAKVAPLLLRPDSAGADSPAGGKPKRKQRASLCPWSDSPEDEPLGFDTPAAPELGPATAPARMAHFAEYCGWVLDKVAEGDPVPIGELQSRAYDRGSGVLAAVPDFPRGYTGVIAKPEERLDAWLHSQTDVAARGLPLSRTTLAATPVQALNLLHGSLVRLGNTAASLRAFGALCSDLRLGAVGEATALAAEADWGALAGLYSGALSPPAAGQREAVPSAGPRAGDVPPPQPRPCSAQRPPSGGPQRTPAASQEEEPPAPARAPPPEVPPRPMTAPPGGAEASLRGAYVPLESSSQAPKTAIDAVPFWVRRLRGILAAASEVA